MDDHVKPKKLSEILNLTTQRISQLSKIGAIPPPTKQGYHVAKSVQGYIKFITQRQDLDKEKEQARWTRVKADISELQLKKLEGSLTPTDDVSTAAFNKARTLRDNILNVPDRIDSILAAEADRFTVNSIMKKELREALEILSDGRKNVGKGRKGLQRGV